MSARAIETFAVEPPTCCAVCRRRASAIGFGVLMPDNAAKVLHCCYDPACVRTVHRIASMDDDKFDAFETRALAEAGDHAGAYLDRIGKSDLGVLTDEQWSTFLGEVLKGFSDSMRRQMQTREAPF